MLSERILSERQRNKLTQEELADKLGISRQSVQKWESGESYPSIDNLITLSKLFDVTLDYLCKGEVHPGPNASRETASISPQYEALHEWESYAKSLPKEYEQCVDEGLDIEEYRDLFSAVAKMPCDVHKDRISDVLFDITRSVGKRKDYAFDEPDEIDEIEKRLDGYAADSACGTLAPEVLSDKIAGGWFGRICGCLLGKPVECIMKPELDVLLKSTGNYPLTRYIDKEDLPADIDGKIKFPIGSRAYPRDLGYAPSDDDTNYVLIAYEVIKRYGRNFKSEDVAKVWLSTQVKDCYCTAERVAYINFTNGYMPPDSARYKNAYREWIGAQIRSDFYGYINPLDPATAADMAYRDARISHTKNGIYGAMWVAAMIAAAFGETDVKKIVLCGLSRIPASSRLYAAIKGVIGKYESGMSKEDFMSDMRSRWNEEVGHNWCHTISNAEIVAAALLYGGGNYAESICYAVSFGFDTDCNGATVGSVLGVRDGLSRLPKQFTDRICDALESTLFGYGKVSVTDMAKKTEEFIEK